VAHVLATGRSHELAEAFQLERFITGTLHRRSGGPASRIERGGTP